ncbi:unnamed protein product [Durusdinium trenchii]|uniref:Uncharacterized protein n=2 Tax=Durusdinium trenchii TaxID=1381693 RepID=A0ABP0JTH2_9DINO
MVMGVSEGVLVNLERGLPFYIGIFFGSMLFFLGWNALNSFFLVGPAVATYVHHRTSGNRKNALTAVLFPANLIGLVVPALLGGLILFLVTTWPYPVACYTFYQRQRAAARSPDAEEPPPVAAGAEAKVVGVVDGEKEDAGGAQVGVPLPVLSECFFASYSIVASCYRLLLPCKHGLILFKMSVQTWTLDSPT